ncbi:hypothetical protein AbraIFM66951_000521 [Aspergillus brasiliensis]|uniref:DNA (cytosine-5-)-methyltransferase n=1 Tax=Aspergillus brasiliensis TaxID=319629 RepID=A0A9W5YWI5_9EURO|nr:hypothetical protein AbraCBS73388_000500 [Aspergillus brasiliensis]GKZ48460.1 hypothetical protein AbraIFM66951_000521 [Aspergillus brasiliensis]
MAPFSFTMPHLCESDNEWPSDSMSIDGDSERSSVTVENDPDRVLSIQTEFRPGPPTEKDPAPAEFNTIIELDSDSEDEFQEQDYLTDAAFNRLLQTWNSRPQQEDADADVQIIDVLPAKRPLKEWCANGIVYTPGQSLEIFDGNFIRIESISQHVVSKEIFFNGRHLLRATRHKGTYVPKWPNELIWVANDKRNIGSGLIKRIVNITFTNSCHVDHDSLKNQRPHGLFCRLKEHFRVKPEDPASLEYISFDEADEGYRILPRNLRKAWRGDTRPFGDGDAPCAIDLEESVIDLTGQSTDKKTNRQYTFGDGFCGAGGVSCGARHAGLRPTWAFDNSEHAAATYRHNFPDAECEESDVFTFLTNNYEFLKVDVTHGSPPCQTFSPAKTIQCATDDANSACIFSCGDLIRKAKPRVHTMEETSGLYDRHRETFHRVVQDFVEIGYSVRWTILNCADFGVPQTRKRLVIIASGPGETLPPFPEATHGLPGSGLRDYVTINQVISRIPHGAADHDVEGALQRRAYDRRPFDANIQARTITCGGGENYHPSGRRGFTNREFACLQTFPLRFRFGRREVRKQIGNAVPPKLAEAIYRTVKASLQRTDQEETDTEQRGRH